MYRRIRLERQATVASTPPTVNRTRKFHTAGVLGHHVVVSNGDEGTIVQHGDEHKHQDGHVKVVWPRGVVAVVWLIVHRLECEHGDEEEEQLQGGRYTVRQKVAEFSRGSISRAITMPSIMAARPGCVSWMIGTAAPAASVAPSTAMPTSAILSAGASLTPSPDHTPAL